MVRDFPGDPVVKTLGFQCRRQEVQSLVGKIRSIMQHGMAKKKKKKKSGYVFTGGRLEDPPEDGDLETCLQREEVN